MSIMGIPVKQNEKQLPPDPVPIDFICLVVRRPKIDSPEDALRKSCHRLFKIYPDGELVCLLTGRGTSLLHGPGPIATLSRQPHEPYKSYSTPPPQPKNPANLLGSSSYEHPIENLIVDYVNGIQKRKEEEESQPQRETEKVFKPEEKNQSQDVDEKVIKPEEKDQSEEEKEEEEEEEKDESTTTEKSRVLKMVEKMKKCNCEFISGKMRKATKKLSKCSIM